MGDDAHKLRNQRADIFIADDPAGFGQGVDSCRLNLLLGVVNTFTDERNQCCI